MTKKQKKSSRQRVQNKRSMKRYFNSVSSLHLANSVQATPVIARSSGFAASIKRASGRGN